MDSSMSKWSQNQKLFISNSKILFYRVFKELLASEREIKLEKKNMRKYSAILTKPSDDFFLEK